MAKDGVLKFAEVVEHGEWRSDGAVRLEVLSDVHLQGVFGWVH